MKKCPYCAEDIQSEAIKCKHCHEFLDGSKRLTASGPSLPWYFKTAFIVLMFLSVPPLALPSIWFHPKMHWGWKIIITLAVIAFCWITWLAIQRFIHQFDELIKMLNEAQL